MGFSGGAQTRYKKYPCKGSCKRKPYETICENIVSRYQTLLSSLPREAVFRRRRPKAHFMTGLHRQPSNKHRTLFIQVRIDLVARLIITLTFTSEGEISWCYRSNQISLVKRLHSTTYFLHFTKRNLNFRVTFFFGHHQVYRE